MKAYNQSDAYFNHKKPLEIIVSRDIAYNTSDMLPKKAGPSDFSEDPAPISQPKHHPVILEAIPFFGNHREIVNSFTYFAMVTVLRI